MTPSRDISRLLEIMTRLRTPGSGCPWDLEQNFATIAPYTIEEAYEVTDAIARGDLDDLRDELGDLLLQVVFHARMAEEQNAFSFGDVVEAITRKMIRRHPHVFADADGNLTPSHVKEAWERIKAEEKGERAARIQSLSMIFAGFAMVAYCLTAVVTVDRFGALRGSALALVSWAVVAALAYGVLTGLS